MSFLAPLFIAATLLLFAADLDDGCVRAECVAGRAIVDAPFTDEALGCTDDCLEPGECRPDDTLPPCGKEEN